MKRSPLRKKGKSPQAKMEEELWGLCRELAQVMYSNNIGQVSCFTCGSPNIESYNRQLGHFIPKSTCGALLKYDMRNLRWQCMRCNIHLGGNGAIYYRRLVGEEGQKYVDELFRDQNKVTKATDHYAMLIPKYRELIEKLKKKKEYERRKAGRVNIRPSTRKQGAGRDTSVTKD